MKWKRIQNKENKADYQTCTQSMTECFLEAQVNLKLFDVMYTDIPIFGNQNCLPPYTYCNKPIFNYTYQNNNKILAFNTRESWRPPTQL